MAKPHRGRSIRDLYARGRGECPVCKRNNVKILYEQEAEGQKFKICKICRAAIKNGKKSLPVTVTAKAIEPETAQTKTVTAESAESKAVETTTENVEQESEA
jgi:hypothetical protein